MIGWELRVVIELSIRLWIVGYHTLLLVGVIASHNGVGRLAGTQILGWHTQSSNLGSTDMLRALMALKKRAQAQ